MLRSVPRSRALATLVGVMLAAVPGRARGAEPPPPAAEEGARTAAAAFHSALEAGDRAAALALLLPEVTVFESGGAELSRDDYAAHHLGADIEFVRATSEEVLARDVIAGSGMAVVTTRSRTTGTFRDKPIDLDGAETLVMRQTDDGWRIAHVHWSSHRRSSP